MSSQVVHQLNREWQRQVDRNHEDVQRWAQACNPLEPCTTLDDVLERVPEAPDMVLGFLIERARSGEEIAARTVLQTMLGKLVLMAGSGSARRQPHALDDLVGHMWLQIYRYPLLSRPQRIAANLALDTLKAALSDWRTTDSFVEIPSPPDFVDDVLELSWAAPWDDLSATTQNVVDAAHGLGLISTAARDLLLAIYGPEELSGQRASERWGCSPQAIRSRCSRAVRGLAPHARTLMAVAA
jgi:DNA-directed RNA polymerase specialized sigma24 family protein